MEKKGWDKSTFIWHLLKSRQETYPISLLFPFIHSYFSFIYVMLILFLVLRKWCLVLFSRYESWDSVRKDKTSKLRGQVSSVSPTSRWQPLVRVGSGARAPECFQPPLSLLWISHFGVTLPSQKCPYLFGRLVNVSVCPLPPGSSQLPWLPRKILAFSVSPPTSCQTSQRPTPCYTSVHLQSFATVLGRLYLTPW